MMNACDDTRAAGEDELDPGEAWRRKAERRRIEIFRHMSVADKWRISAELYWSARRVKAAYLRSRHPEWTQEEVETEVRRRFTRHDG